MTDEVTDPARAQRQARHARRAEDARRSPSTPDQRLLDTGSQLNTHSDMWRVLRIQSEFVEGFGALATLGPAVSVFGSARLGPEDPAYGLTVEVGRLLAEAGFAVLTGRGRGLMGAGNKGGTEAGVLSFGLGIELARGQGVIR